jgi:phage terminase large subunit
LAEIEAWFPEKLRFLFGPARYKVVRGGRGSGKSWGFARALLLTGANRPLRVLCTREVQKSIAQSVHQLLKDQIQELGLGHVYEVLATEIRAANGTLFIFSGLSDQTAESLKSFEGVGVCWCEEAQSISRQSWDILIPTIRKAESEIWVSFNPQLESDETYRRFVTEPPPDCISIEMNYGDNKKFPKVLEKERLHALATMKADDYGHIWEGKCKPAVEGAIYFDAMSASIAAGRIREVPHDASLKTHVVFDLGMADAMTLILVQKVASEIRIIHYIEGTQRILADYNAELRALRLDDQPINWGTLWLPHDGFHKRHQTGKDDATILQGLGWTVQAVPMTQVNSGIDRAREIFPRVYFNKDRTTRLIECLKRYRWNINSKTGEAVQPLHDEFSHGADAFRYLALVADQLINDEWGGALKYPKLSFA